MKKNNNEEDDELKQLFKRTCKFDKTSCGAIRK
jgi:hypothetical protein